MSRSVADATRFTATSPHAFTKPTASRLSATKAATPSSKNSSTQPKHAAPGQNPEGPVETPAQKVARLRAAYAAKRASEISAWDKIVVRGRIIADSAHRITVMGLVGLTIIAGGVTVFSLGDMIIYNRRKKKEWYAEQNRKWREAMALAIEAEANGTANRDQILLLNQERAAQAADEEKKNKKGIWKSIKGLFTTEGLKAEDTGFGQEHTPPKADVEEGPVPIPPPEVPDIKDLMNEPPPKKSILETIEEKRRQGERLLEGRGLEPGPLDKMGEQARAAAASEARGKSWSSWLSSSK